VPYIPQIILSLSLSLSLLMRSHYVTQALNLMILLLQPPEFWDYRGVPPLPFHINYSLMFFGHILTHFPHLEIEVGLCVLGTR
jgi:hypothetical protein